MPETHPPCHQFLLEKYVFLFTDFNQGSERLSVDLLQDISNSQATLSALRLQLDAFISLSALANSTSPLQGLVPVATAIVPVPSIWCPMTQTRHLEQHNMEKAHCLGILRRRWHEFGGLLGNLDAAFAYARDEILKEYAHPLVTLKLPVFTSGFPELPSSISLQTKVIHLERLARRLFVPWKRRWTRWEERTYDKTEIEVIEREWNAFPKKAQSDFVQQFEGAIRQAFTAAQAGFQAEEMRLAKLNEELQALILRLGNLSALKKAVASELLLAQVSLFRAQRNEQQQHTLWYSL